VQQLHPPQVYTPPLRENSLLVVKNRSCLYNERDSKRINKLRDKTENLKQSQQNQPAIQMPFVAGLEAVIPQC